MLISRGEFGMHIDWYQVYLIPCTKQTCFAPVWYM